MADDKDYSKKLFLRLNSTGHIELDEDYLWDGCDTPEIDPEIDLTPVPLKKLTQLLANLYSDDPEQEDIDRFKNLLSEINESSKIIEQLIQSIEAKLS